MLDRFQLAVKFIHDMQIELQHSLTERPTCAQPFVCLVEALGELSGDLLANQQRPAEIGVNEVYHSALIVAVMALRLASEGSASFPYDPAQVTANVS